VTLAHNLNVVAEGQALPIYDLRQPLFLALLGTYLTEVQALENAYWDLYIGTMLPAAAGDALDMLGGLVGEPRQGRTDAEYRLWIAARAQLLHSNGTPPDLLALARAVLPAAVGVRLSEYYPGAIAIDLVGPVSAATGAELGTMYKQAKAAGIRIETISSVVDSGLVFTLGDVALAPELDVQRGTSDVDQLVGGVLASVT
jgi:hypothetical protein